MSDTINLTGPVQITDGTNYAHVTVTEGFIAYADSENSAAWHSGDRVMSINPPFIIWMKPDMGAKAVIKVTRVAGG